VLVFCLGGKEEDCSEGGSNPPPRKSFREKEGGGGGGGGGVFPHTLGKGNESLFVPSLPGWGRKAEILNKKNRGGYHPRSYATLGRGKGGGEARGKGEKLGNPLYKGKKIPRPVQRRGIQRYVNRKKDRF